jgi:hypothetical protein
MSKLENAFNLFDAYNQQSPTLITWEGSDYPAEYFYAIKLYEWVKKLDPHASESLLLASRSQHIGRWEIPRNTYPDGRVGYLKWRSDLSRFHASKASEFMLAAGYNQAEVDRVREIILKQKIKSDEEVQTIENALCLVFLEFQFDELIDKQPDEKMINILRKTWGKMSEPGRNMALTLTFSEKASSLLEIALGAN